MGDSTLFSALKFDAIAMAESALADGAYVNTTNNQGMSPLMAATLVGRDEFVQLFINHGAEVEFDMQGFTPLMIAAQEGHANITALLIEAGANLNAKTADGMSVLMLATRDGHLEIVEQLISKGVDLNATTSGGTSALMIARQFDQQKALKLLEEALGCHNYGVDIDIVNQFAVKFVDDDES